METEPNHNTDPKTHATPAIYITWFCCTTLSCNKVAMYNCTYCTLQQIP